MIPGYSRGAAVGVCPACEIDLVQNIAERKQVCLNDGHRRLVMAVKYTVKQRLGQKGVMEK